MGRPKALLPIGGRAFLENILDAISHTSIEHTIVVLGHHREQIERSLRLPAVVFNPVYEQGMITSFQAGIRGLSWDTSGAFLFLVDHPLVEPATIEAMIMNLAPNRIVLPTFEGRRGHPVLFSTEVLEEILALSSSEGANIVVRKNPSRIVEVPVNSPGILVDIDTPEQFERLREDYP
jgi:molybdenum cofactor cytidylyltransferase